MHWNASKVFLLLIGICATLVIAVSTGTDNSLKALSLHNRHISSTRQRKPGKGGQGKGGNGSIPSKTFKGKCSFFYPEREDDVSCGGGRSQLGNLMVVAVNGKQMKKSMCGKKMNVKYKGKSIVVKVVDTCGSCPFGKIDLSSQAFAKLAKKDVGIIKVEWRML